MYLYLLQNWSPFNQKFAFFKPNAVKLKKKYQQVLNVGGFWEGIYKRGAVRSQNNAIHFGK